ncbi:MAG: hypothetical protein QM705_13560 [Ancrocorticia sp.]
MKIRDLLLIDPAFAAGVSAIPSDANPFKEEAALQEAQLLDFRFDALAGVAGLLFELRQSLQPWESNTGVLVADRVSAFAWSGPKREPGVMALPIVGSEFSVKEGAFKLTLDVWLGPGAELSLSAGNAAFYTGNVPGLTQAPPDYTENDRSMLIGQIPAWDSLFEPTGASWLIG